MLFRSVDKLAALAKDAHMPAVAITDTGNLFGALEFSQYCTGKGIQPIIGCQIALTRSDNPRLAPDPIVLLAQNALGLANLQKLSSQGWRWCTRWMEGEMTPAPVRYATTRWQRTDFGRPVSSIQFRTVTPMAASACWAAKPRARSRGPISAL